MLGAPWSRPLKPLTKNFWLITITAPVSSSCSNPRATGFPWKKAGTGQPPMVWPMEKYISTARKTRELMRRFFSTGVSWSARASSPWAARAEGAAPLAEAP